MNDMNRAQLANSVSPLGVTNLTSYSRFTDRPSAIVGTRVASLQDVDLGKVDEVVMDAFNSSIEFMVMSYGGFLGFGEKRYAVPWHAVHFDQDKQVYVVNLSQDEIDDLPAYKADEWPDFGDDRWNRNPHRFFEMTPFWMP
ncbi:MAG: PRC-barrel domain-containing protein [Betaproteobacteria bacterium]